MLNIARRFKFIFIKHAAGYFARFADFDVARVPMNNPDTEFRIEVVVHLDGIAEKERLAALWAIRRRISHDSIPFGLVVKERLEFLC